MNYPLSGSAPAAVISLMLLPIIFFVTLQRWCSSRYFWAAWGVATVGWVLRSFDFVFPISRIAPENFTHLGSLIALMSLLTVGVLGLLFNRVGTHFDSRHSVIAIVAIAVVSGSGLYLYADRAEDVLRTNVETRSGVTFRVIEFFPMLENQRGLQGLEARLETDSCAVSEDDFRPDKDQSLNRKMQDIEAPRGVLFIMIDTLREDRIGAHRHGRKVTPNLTKFASESLYYNRAYATAPATRRSLGAMLTGKNIGVDQFPQYEGEFTPIHRLLNERGVTTAVIPVHSLTDKMLEDFDIVDDGVARNAEWRHGATSELVIPKLKTTLKKLEYDESIFVFTHLMDPHAPYHSHEGFDFGRTAEERYDSEVAFTDDAMGTLFEFLKQEGMYDDLAIIIVSDHGEEFYDHRGVYHGVQLFEESIKVPLIVRIPGIEPAAVPTPVSVADLAPTIAALFDLPFEGATIGGVLPGLEAKSDDRPVFSSMSSSSFRWSPRGEHAGRVAVTRGNYKVIYNIDRDILEVYDLAEDPDEQLNLADEPPGKLNHMLCELLTWYKQK